MYELYEHISLDNHALLYLHILLYHHIILYHHLQRYKFITSQYTYVSLPIHATPQHCLYHGFQAIPRGQHLGNTPMHVTNKSPFQMAYYIKKPMSYEWFEGGPGRAYIPSLLPPCISFERRAGCILFKGGLSNAEQFL